MVPVCRWHPGRAPPTAPTPPSDHSGSCRVYTPGVYRTGSPCPWCACLGLISAARNTPLLPSPAQRDCQVVTKKSKLAFINVVGTVLISWNINTGWFDMAVQAVVFCNLLKNQTTNLIRLHGVEWAELLHNSLALVQPGLQFLQVIQLHLYLLMVSQIPA